MLGAHGPYINHGREPISQACVSPDLDLIILVYRLYMSRFLIRLVSPLQYNIGSQYLVMSAKHASPELVLIFMVY
jgi:hypothetical protein